MAEPIVVCQGLQKTFVHMGRPLEVLRGIDLTIDQGEIVAIVGQSGAGKSTLLHCIGTLDIPSKGKIRLGRDEITGLSSTKLANIRNRAIGFVFQFHHLLPEFSALENVMMPGLIQGRSQKEMQAVAMALLEEVGLGPRATHRPGELSGGEQQRVAMARALVLSPKLLLADEPTGNLDSKTGQQIQDLFFTMNARHGTTVIVVTHDLNFAKSMPRVVSMKDGLIDSDDRMLPRAATKDGHGEPPSAGASPAFSTIEDGQEAEAPAPDVRSAETAHRPATSMATSTPSAGQVVTGMALGAVTNWLVSAAVFGIGVLVYVLLPASLSALFPLVFGAVLALGAGLAAERGYPIGFGFNFLPLWLLGAGILAVGCYRLWGLPGLLGTIAVVIAAALFGMRRLRALSSDAASGPGAASSSPELGP